MSVDDRLRRRFETLSRHRALVRRAEGACSDPRAAARRLARRRLDVLARAGALLEQMLS